jgi:hypothetical protein
MARSILVSKLAMRDAATQGCCCWCHKLAALLQ